MTAIRVAIVGAGIGREHLAAYRGLGDLFEVRAVVDRDGTRIDEIRAGDSFTALNDLDQALADPRIDLIDICLPTHLHVPATLAALGAGKHVICEKPVATSMREIALLRDAVQASGRCLFPVFQYRWGHAFTRLRALARAGIAGHPLSAAAETHWHRSAAYYAVPWRGTWAGEQGGAVLTHAIHNHDLLCHFMGPVAAVNASLATRVNPIETEDCAAITMEMANGSLCTSSITLGGAIDETRLRFVFSGLTATSGSTPYAPGTGTWRFDARDPADQPEIDSIVAATPAERPGFAGFLTETARALRGVGNTAVTLADGEASVALVTAIYASAHTRRRATLPILPDHPLYDGWQPREQSQ